MKAICFVLMPFGKKKAADGRLVDFDAVYKDLIEPAVLKAGFDPLRADDEQVGGVIHKAIFERLILCDYAVADLSTANANVFYELGFRHAVRPWATQLIFAKGWGDLPFDVELLRALPYQLGPNGLPSNVTADGAELANRLEASRNAVADSPAFQLLEGYPDRSRLKTDLFLERVNHVQTIKNQLADARKKGFDAIKAVEGDIGRIEDADAAIVIDLFLSYRAVEAWGEMAGLVGRMARPLAATTMVREQLSLALNRSGRGEEAERILLALIADRGGTSETYGILGRVYKDRWEVAMTAGKDLLARGLLEKAIAAYRSGFEMDWRDPYPGVNALNLMDRLDSNVVDQQFAAVVMYAVERRMAHGQVGYWDYATLLECLILSRQQPRAVEVLPGVLAALEEAWQAETTARNLSIIADGRRGKEDVSWVDGIIEALRGR